MFSFPISMKPCVSADFGFDMDRAANRADLVVYRTSDSLAYPLKRVGRKSESQFRIEFFNGSHESDIPFLHEIGEIESAIVVFPGYRNDEPEIAVDEAFFSPKIAGTDFTSQINLLLRGEERKLPKLADIVGERIDRMPALLKRFLPGGFLSSDLPSIGSVSVFHV